MSVKVEGKVVVQGCACDLSRSSSLALCWWPIVRRWVAGTVIQWWLMSRDPATNNATEYKRVDNNETVHKYIAFYPFVTIYFPIISFYRFLFIVLIITISFHISILRACNTYPILTLTTFFWLYQFYWKFGKINRKD